MLQTRARLPSLQAKVESRDRLWNKLVELDSRGKVHESQQRVYGIALGWQVLVELSAIRSRWIADFSLIRDTIWCSAMFTAISLYSSCPCFPSTMSHPAMQLLERDSCMKLWRLWLTRKFE
jgi:hypothetical protein